MLRQSCRSGQSGHISYSADELPASYGIAIILIGIAAVAASARCTRDGCSWRPYTWIGKYLWSLIATVFRKWKTHINSHINSDDLFTFSTVAHTRGHGYKLYKPRCVSSVRRNFFIERIINVWNFLPHAVDFSSLSKFKLNRVDFTFHLIA